MLLKYIILILSTINRNSVSIFEKAAKRPEFEEVKTFSYLIKNPNFFFKNTHQNNSQVELYLDKPAKTISLFLNLRNFLLLYTLCSMKRNRISTNVQEWKDYIMKKCLKIGNQLINIDEIENLIFNMKSIQFIENQKSESLNFLKLMKIV